MRHLRITALFLVVLAVGILRGGEPPAPREPSSKPDAPAAKDSGTIGSKNSPSNRVPQKPGKKGDKAAEKVDPEQAERDRKEFFEKTGILLWPELTDAQQQDFVKKQKEYLEEVKKKIAAGPLKLYETSFFLFYSDIPQQYVKMYVPYLDAMYKDLCNAFGLDPKTNIFQGKCLVIAFAEEASFQEFEKTYYETEKPGAQGLSHCRDNGEVVMACFAGNDSQYLASVMVHETSHGFMFRYKSNKVIPNWLNEGAAEWIAKHVVTRDTAIPRKVQASIARLRQTGSMGGTFFTTEHIEAWQYGLAAHLTEFLLKYNAKGYKQMIDDIKVGKTWQESLQANFKLTPEELAAKYGQWIGLPGLTP